MPKVASSSISEAIIPHLPPLDSPAQFPFPQEEVWKRAGRLGEMQEYLSLYNTSTSFFISRHPLDRLASAYRYWYYFTLYIYRTHFAFIEHFNIQNTLHLQNTLHIKRTLYIYRTPHSGKLGGDHAVIIQRRVLRLFHTKK